MRLSEIRLRERRSTLLATFYALAGWGLYVSLWYAEWLPGTGFAKAVDQAVKGMPVLMGPILYVVGFTAVRLIIIAS
jgi:endoplasmic reticulum junction formation protein lunapark